MEERRNYKPLRCMKGGYGLYEARTLHRTGIGLPRLGFGERRNGIFAASVSGRAFNISWLFAHTF